MLNTQSSLCGNQQHKDKLGKWVRQAKLQGKVFSNSLLNFKGRRREKLTIHKVEFACFN